jgi:hypothetical protein
MIYNLRECGMPFEEALEAFVGLAATPGISVPAGDRTPLEDRTTTPKRLRRLRTLAARFPDKNTLLAVLAREPSCCSFSAPIEGDFLSVPPLPAAALCSGTAHNWLPELIVPPPVVNWV